jgi:hypothetical protein
LLSIDNAKAAKVLPVFTKCDEEKLLRHLLKGRSGRSEKFETKEDEKVGEGDGSEKKDVLLKRLKQWTSNAWVC